MNCPYRHHELNCFGADLPWEKRRCKEYEAESTNGRNSAYINNDGLYALRV